MFGRTIHIPPIGEYVADGAAKQAAWALSGKDEVPTWSLGEIRAIAPKNPGPEIVEDYMELISI